MSLLQYVMVLIGLGAALVAVPESEAGVRIKDIIDFEGARGNQLYGFGLVVGLAGAGAGRVAASEPVAGAVNVSATEIPLNGPLPLFSTRTVEFVNDNSLHAQVLKLSPE